MIVLAGPRGRRRRVSPRWLRPTLIEQEYTRRILPFAELAREMYAPVMGLIPELVDAAAREREDGYRKPDTSIDLSIKRLDAGEGGRVRELLGLARARLTAALASNERALEDLATMVARRTEVHQKAQLARTVRAVLGVDVLMSDRKLAATMEGFVSENVALIKSVPLETASEIEKRITRAIGSGQRWRDISKELEGEHGFARKRAHVIARDQIGKFYGQVNETRQKELGVTRYTWRCVRDERVRGNPAGLFPRVRFSHWHRDGTVFEWEHPPPDGHPGQAVQCRCYAEPDLSHLLGE